jgi:hypothetical protein
MVQEGVALFRTSASAAIDFGKETGLLHLLKKFALSSCATPQLAAVQTCRSSVDGLRLILALLNVERGAIDAGLEDADSGADEICRVPGVAEANQSPT